MAITIFMRGIEVSIAKGTESVKTDDREEKWTNTTFAEVANDLEG
jgi:hypothetical protein